MEESKEVKKRSYKADYEAEKQKTEELTNDLKRLQADFENYRKRIEKEMHDFEKLSNHKLMQKLLVVLDDFDHTIISLQKTAKDDTNIQGVKLLHDKYRKLLFDEGLTPIKSIGEKFDPFKHDVIKKELNEKEEGVILEEIQKGYMFNNKILRTSKVKVSSGIPQTEINSDQKSDLIKDDKGVNQDG